MIAIVAEISGNHLGSKAKALELVRLAAKSGATHVKFQAYTPESMVCFPQKVETGPWAGRDLDELYASNRTPYEWFPDLFAEAFAAGVVPFASVFDLEGLAMLEALGGAEPGFRPTPGLTCSMYKIASFELGHLDLVEAVAATGKPMILSTGLATNERLGMAMERGRLVEKKLLQHVDVTLLQCVSSYPARTEDTNLARMVAMGKLYGVPVGVSDHSLPDIVPMLAAALGATMVEKHFTATRDEGDDAAFSLTPHRFAEMVAAVNSVLDIMGSDELPEGSLEHEALLRHVWVTRSIAAGEQITRENTGCYRGQSDVLAEHHDDVLGRSALYDMEPGPFRL